jgi:hypothetical protein
MKKYCLASLICCSLGRELNSNLDDEAIFMPNLISKEASAKFDHPQMLLG